MEQPSLLDDPALMGQIADIIADSQPREYTMHTEAGRHHVVLEAACREHDRTALILADTGPYLTVAAYPCLAQLTPDLARRLAAHLTRWADR